MCEFSSTCPDGFYCERTLERCLPRAVGEACEFRPETEEFELTEEWSWTGDGEVFPAHDQVMMAPMVANLTDDNGDGAIDQNDIPDIVFNTFAGGTYTASGVLRAISGDGGARLWPTGEPGYRTSPGSQVAIADVDPASPGPEIATCSTPVAEGDLGRLMLLAADGSLLRTFDEPGNEVKCFFGAPAVGDMDGDGVPEIVVNYTAVHADGTVVRRFQEDRAGGYPALADVDDDGELELVASFAAYNLDGTAVWDRSGEFEAGHVAVADLDLDSTSDLGDVEVVIIEGGKHAITALDARTGETIWGPFDINPPELAAEVSASGTPVGGGPPTIANFDDDPYPEVAFAGGFAYVVFEHDGSRSWYGVSTDRSSRSTGSSIFDFEGDGRAEVLYNDEQKLRVYRGTDGEVLLEQCNTSGTLAEYPIVVDVDNDNGAEIVLMENNYAFQCGDRSTGIHVFGHPENLWVRTRRIWNQHTYHVTNINEDGTVPRREEQHWRVEGLNSFRQNLQPDGLFDAPDLVLADLVPSTASCPEALSLSVRVVNQGAVGVRAGIPVSFYVVEEGERRHLGRATTTRALLPGESEVLTLDPPFAIEDPEAEVSYRFLAVVNDPDDMPLAGLNECRTENNEIRSLDATCPVIM